MNLTNTKGIGTDRLKVLIHGPSGCGKTFLASTTGDHSKTLIISAEAGLLSLSGFGIDVVEVDGYDSVREVFAWVRAGCPVSSDEDTERHVGMPYEWIILDSISEIAEQVLHGLKRELSDGRKAYGEMGERMIALMKAFRDLDSVHVVMTAKQERVQDDGGMILYGPAFPGKMVTQNVSYLFDEVFALRTDRDEHGEVFRSLQCHRDASYDCKDRSGRLDVHEPANLHDIWKKIATDPKEEEDASN